MTKQEYRQWEKRHALACRLVRVKYQVGKLSEIEQRNYLDELIMYGQFLTPERTEEIIKELEML